MVRAVVGLVRNEVRVLRKVVENARAIASMATSAVSVFVDKKGVCVVVGSFGGAVSDIRKRRF
jgi:hypothetical protein